MFECKMIHGDTDPLINDAYFVRDIVFTQEQGYPAAIDIDEYDQIAWQCILYKDNRPIGTARLIPENDTGKIGRVAILREFRGFGLGVMLMKEVMDTAENLGFQNLQLSAQSYAVPFYEKLGFGVAGDEYLEDGEPHVPMEKVIIRD